MDDLDLQVRFAAFRFLEDQMSAIGSEGALRRSVLAEGFAFHGERVPIIGPQGIFKPRVLREVPLSITTVPAVEGRERPYEDLLGTDGLLRYRYRGSDPGHPDNAGLRRAMERRSMLVYCHGIVPGLYQVAWPVFVVGDDPGRLTFTVNIDERDVARLTNVASDEPPVTELRRQYVTREFQQRVHQRAFRERVLHAYQRHCAICRLRRDTLLEAAHIVADRDPLGVPEVRNGVALCKLHHAAFDADLIGISPDRIVHVQSALLEEHDGPMLVHGLQGFHGRELFVPRREQWQPDRAHLEQRFAAFLRASA